MGHLTESVACSQSLAVQTCNKGTGRKEKGRKEGGESKSLLLWLLFTTTPNQRPWEKYKKKEKHHFQTSKKLWRQKSLTQLHRRVRTFVLFMTPGWAEGGKACRGLGGWTIRPWLGRKWKKVGSGPIHGGPTEFYSGNWSILYAIWEISFYF